MKHIKLFEGFLNETFNPEDFPYKEGDLFICFSGK